MKLRLGPWTGAGELDPQQLAEQVMVAVPDPTRIERDQEQIRALDLAQNASSVLGTQDGVAQRRGKTVQNRRPEKEASRVVLHSVEHLGCQIVGDMTMVGGELLDAVAGRVETGEP